MNNQPNQGMGCIGKGCLIVGAVGIALTLIVGCGMVFLYGTAINRLTSDRPVDLRRAAPSSTEFQTATLALERLRAALTANREETVAFTAADLNALVAQHPDFADARDRVRFEISDSILTLDLSVPLNSARWPRLERRWFNGTLRFGLNYVYEQFTFHLVLIQAGQWRVPDWLLTQDFVSSFNQSFTKSFHQAIKRDSKSGAFWKHVKHITVDGDKLVLVTQRLSGQAGSDLAERK